MLVLSPLQHFGAKIGTRRVSRVRRQMHADTLKEWAPAHRQQPGWPHTSQNMSKLRAAPTCCHTRCPVRIASVWTFWWLTLLFLLIPIWTRNETIAVADCCDDVSLSPGDKTHHHLNVVLTEPDVDLVCAKFDFVYICLHSQRDPVLFYVLFLCWSTLIVVITRGKRLSIDHYESTAWALQNLDLPRSVRAVCVCVCVHNTKQPAETVQGKKHNCSRFSC